MTDKEYVDELIKKSRQIRESIEKREEHKKEHKKIKVVVTVRLSDEKEKEKEKEYDFVEEYLNGTKWDDKPSVEVV